MIYVRNNLNPSFTICEVKYKEQSGNGAIYGCEYPKGTFRTLFITSFLEISNVNEITDVRLVFEDKTIGNQYLTPDWVKWLWTSPVDKYNVTVIEFSPTALKVLSRTKYERLTSDVPNEHKVVSVYQYREGILNISNGYINKINEESIQYSSAEKTEEYIGGFPLLNDQFKVVGIDVGPDELEGRGNRKAVHIRFILEGFKNYVKEKLGGRTENELWLEKIAQIPKNEFDRVGSGGFGTVYKIKASNSETFVAVKVVSGLGNLDEYKRQVDALLKEYRVVTSLENHQRCIQFFAIVPDDKNYRIMIVMEYMEGGSLADKLRDQKPLLDNSVLKYLTQILEGVSFLHRIPIYHSDIKPANILFNTEDNLKISDFGIAAGRQLSATSSHIKGDFHYMSPERMQGADRSAANDIWSVGATFVHMISGQPLNHLNTLTQLINNISHYKISINGRAYIEYLQSLNNTDFKKRLLSLTLRNKSNRANGPKLLRILFPHSKRLPKEAFNAAGDMFKPYINGMSYNSARDELFLADWSNGVVRAMRVCNAGDLHDVYRSPVFMSPFVWSVCHMSDSDTLLVCLGSPSKKKWLVALSRNGSEWREAHRVQTEKEGFISCALSNSRVLIGHFNSTYMELFRVESGPRIVRIHRIHVPEKYWWFSATCGRDTLVAMSYPQSSSSNSDNSVRLHQMRGDRLVELARIQLKEPQNPLWLSDRLLVADYDSKKQSHAVIELEVSDTRLKRGRELIATSENIRVTSLCAVNDRLAIFNVNTRDILHYSFV